jgi:hypothetical protein
MQNSMSRNKHANTSSPVNHRMLSMGATIKYILNNMTAN